MEENTKRERGIHDLFLAGVMLKGVDGIFEMCAGTFLLYARQMGFLHTLVVNELVEDPNDFLANHVAMIINIPDHTRVFAGLYLLGHGILKLIFAVGLLKEYVWAYPVGIVFLFLFIAYDLSRVILVGSITFAVLTI